MSPFKDAADCGGGAGEGSWWPMLFPEIPSSSLRNVGAPPPPPRPLQPTGLLFLGGLSWTPLQSLENKHLPECPTPHFPPADDLWGRGGSATRQGFLV